MRGEEQGSIAAAENLGLEKTAKFGSGDSVKTARGFIEEKDARLMKQSAGEAEALHCAGRKCTNLAIEGFFDMELFRKKSNALRDAGVRKMIESAEEPQIFAAGKASVEAKVAAGVVTELAAHGARIENGIVSRDLRAAAGGKEQRGDNSEQRRFAGPISPQQGQRFARTHFEGDPGESDDARPFERLQEASPAAARGRKRLLKGIDNDGCVRHYETYNVSVARRQSAREATGGKQEIF